MAKKIDKQDSKCKKLKFPIARIKRIMQSDDEIGKVSTSAPVVLSKAIELFLKEFIGEIAKIAKAKKINIGEVKEVVNKDKRFDFLKIVVEEEIK